MGVESGTMSLDRPCRYPLDGIKFFLEAPPSEKQAIVLSQQSPADEYEITRRNGQVTWTLESGILAV